MNRLPKLAALEPDAEGWGYFLCTSRELRPIRSGELLLDFGLPGQGRQLQVGVRQDRQKLPPGDRCPVLHRQLLDPSALDRVEIYGDERGNSRPKRQKLVKMNLIMNGTMLPLHVQIILEY